ALESKLSIQKTGFPSGIVDEGRRLWKAKGEALKKDNKRRIEREFLEAFQEGNFNSNTIRNRAEKIIARWKSHANPSASPDYDQAIHSLARSVENYFKNEAPLRSEARSQAPENFRTWWKDRRPAIEKPLVEWALTKSAGVLLEAARLLAINRNTLAKTIKEYELTAAEYTGLTKDTTAEVINLQEVLNLALSKAIEEAMSVTGGNKTEAAELLGISRNHELFKNAKTPENISAASPEGAFAVPEKLPRFRPWPERAKEWEKGLFFAALNQAKGKNGKVKIVNLARILGVNRNTTAILFKKYKDEKPPSSAVPLDTGPKMVSMETFKKAYVITALILYQGESQETTAEKMGIDRNTLRKWIGDLNIDPKSFEKRPLMELVIENKEEIRLILNETEKQSLYEKILGEVSKKGEPRETPQERERIAQAAEALGPRFALSAGSFFEIESYKPLVIQAGNLKERMRALSDGELAARAKELKEKIAGQKEKLEEFLVLAFAIFNEAARRKTGMEPSPEQMFAALAIHRGRAVEMQPGEGKTLSIALAAFVNALLGRGVHIHTFNDYLAKRDAELMTPVFSFLRLKVGLVEHSEKQRAAKRDAYSSDITYGSKELFVFDFLRDRMVYDKKEKVQKPEAPALVVVDEGDSVLLDEAADPLVAGVEQTGKSKGWPEDDIYLQVYRFAASLREGEDFNLDPFNRDAEILPEVFADRRKELKAIRWDLEELKSMIRQALVVRYFYERKSEYVIEGNKVVLVDEFTGRLKMSHVLGNHKHQLIAAKEIVESDGSLAVKIQRPVFSHNLITYQNYYREM
ncbi:MAG TPA: helix-turn-helix domain-containing protein, partial [bacterium]|nr:helix-turn-helix domain-containing protein [bacterium]